MKRLWLFALVGAVGTLGTPAAQASPVWSPDAHVVHPSPIWSLNWQFGTNVLISNTGRGTIRFTSNNTTSYALDNTATVAKITENSSVSAAHPDPITHQNYGFYLKVTDWASHTSRSLWFSGFLSGSFSKTTSSLTNHFNTPTSYLFVLGRDHYTVSLGTITLPSASNHFQGSIAVNVKDPKVPGGSNPTPEPSALALAGLGLALTGLRAWRRRRGAKGPLAA